MSTRHRRHMRQVRSLMTARKPCRLATPTHLRLLPTTPRRKLLQREGVLDLILAEVVTEVLVRDLTALRLLHSLPCGHVGLSACGLRTCCPERMRLVSESRTGMSLVAQSSTHVSTSHHHLLSIPRCFMCACLWRRTGLPHLLARLCFGGVRACCLRWFRATSYPTRLRATYWNKVLRLGARSPFGFQLLGGGLVRSRCYVPVALHTQKPQHVWQ